MWTPQQKVQCVLWLAEEKSVTPACSSYMDRWIGRRGSIAWPNRSPNMTSLVYFLRLCEGCCVAKRTASTGIRIKRDEGEKGSWAVAIGLASREYRRQEYQRNNSIRKSGRQESTCDNLNDIQEYSRKRNDSDRIKAEIEKKKSNPVRKSYCVLQFAKINSVTVVQRYFRARFQKSPPTPQARESICDWQRKFETTDCFCKGKSPGRPPVSEEKVERAAHERSPQKSIARASLELQIPQQDEILPQRWIGHAADDNNALERWPPRSPDLTPCDFLLWGFVKDRLFVPPLSFDLDEMKGRIRRELWQVSMQLCYIKFGMNLIVVLMCVV
ncbi:hypothetical protein ANN_19437 [Periplaneta americana]|uniref:DUF4817 domain-containing protein n=1 Tax=Periplaneta americana TaxID=6978 RepID=A0ABQ8SAD4_PERAM|nr:hypothetical protein ANN_19437 [Periplaneta americana]